MIFARRLSVVLAILLMIAGPAAVLAGDVRPDLLAQRIQPYVDCLSGADVEFRISAHITVPIDGRPQAVSLVLARFDEDSFLFEADHADYAVRIRRSPGKTVFALPKHQVAYVGTGSVEGDDHLTPTNVLTRLVSLDSMVSVILPLFGQKDALPVAFLLTQLAKLTYDADQSAWTISDDVKVVFQGRRHGLKVDAGDTTVCVELSAPNPVNQTAILAKQWKVVELDRTELERQMVRGVRRALEVLAPGPSLTIPEQSRRTTDHGELHWVDGQRIALLWGTPEQIGRAHGRLLKTETGHCMDSVLHAFGLVRTIETGRWFLDDLKSAYRRLEPHIPNDHKIETRALARSLGVDEELAEAVNVFPELFHCSGFAAFGQATKGGKLYHGRVLDYMTMIGLQDAATTFIVAVDGKTPFANVGYAGFIGSVSGMNANAISLGEMGGGGQGKWDGVPMATLMRRALEECSTLQDVIQLWKTSPRTCEYYYVFADGKSNQAVGVAATPESIEFVRPGQSHERLGEGIEDVVVLSAGSRLETLRSRVQECYGQIDIVTAQWLMSRPVAMSSNLHNVLFVPADGLMFVANADHQRIGAERPYVRIDVQNWLRVIKQRSQRN